MKYIIRHHLRNLTIEGKEYYVTSFFSKLINELELIYPEHTFEIQLDESYEKYGYGGIYSCMSLSIINPENNNYILISTFDNWKYHFMTHLGWRPKKMKQFFYAGGFNFLDYFDFKWVSRFNSDLEFPDNINDIYGTFFYFPYFDCCYEEMMNLYDDKSEKKSALFFRGWMWDFRKQMVDDLNRNDIIVIDKNEGNQNLGYTEYLREMGSYSANLSLPGGTEICNRDIESFGVGSPVLRPFVQINYSDPLISNYHYINFYHYCDYTTDGNPKYMSYEDFKRNLLYTWDKVKDNKEYLAFISKNAREWFVRNCSADNNIKMLLNKIDLNNINE